MNKKAILIAALFALVCTTVGVFAQDAANSIQERKKWAEKIEKLTAHYKENPPIEIVYDPDSIKVEKIDYAKETASVSVLCGVFPDYDALVPALKLQEDLERTGHAKEWQLSVKPESYTNRAIVIEYALKNDKGKTIGTAKYKERNNLYFSAPQIGGAWFSVNANDITDKMNIELITSPGGLVERGIIHVVRESLKEFESNQYSDHYLQLTRDDYVFMFNTTRVSVIKYNGSNKKITLPSKIRRWNVTQTGGISNVILDDVTSVVIPNGITRIAPYAFGGTPNFKLFEVTIPPSVTYIGDSAFENGELTQLPEIKNVWYIGKSAFHDNRLTNVVCPPSVTSLGKDVFTSNFIVNERTYERRSYLKTLTLPANLVVFGSVNHYREFETDVYADIYRLLGSPAATFSISEKNVNLKEPNSHSSTTTIQIVTVTQNDKLLGTFTSTSDYDEDRDGKMIRWNYESASGEKRVVIYNPDTNASKNGFIYIWGNNE